MGSRQFWLLLILITFSGVVFYERANSGGTHRLGEVLRNQIDSLLGRPERPPLIEEVARLDNTTGIAPGQAISATARTLSSELGAQFANFASASCTG